MIDNNGSSLLDWKDAFEAGSGAVGGKGWNLARLDRYGFRVPRGGVLTARAYRDFVDHNGLAARLQSASREAEGLDPSDPRLSELANGIMPLFLSGQLPALLEREIRDGLTRWGLVGSPLAVRSSAASEDSPAASFAGIHDSFLNVRGPEAIASAIKACWASVWGPRALVYRRRMGLSADAVTPAVILMAMADAAVSGVAFSCHPASGREDQVFISANFGLGESVVGGTVDPDEYTVHVGFHSLNQSIDSRRIGRKEKKSLPLEAGGTALVDGSPEKDRQALSDDDIIRLTRLVRRVFTCLGHCEQHQDVEWVFDGSEFFLVQSRPVTAVPRYTYPALRNQRTIWSNANFRDTLPMVISPLAWSNMADALDTVLQSVMAASGYPTLPGISRKRLFEGRGYFNVSVIQWENYDSFASPPQRVNTLLGGHHPAIRLPEREPITRLLGRVRRNIAYGKAAKRVRRTVDAEFRRLSACAESDRKRDLSALSDRQVLALWSEMEETYRSAPDVQFALVGSAASYMMLILLLDRFFKGRGEALVNALLAGKETTTSGEQGYRLADLSRTASSDEDARALLIDGERDPLSWRDALPEGSPFRREFSAFLEEFGHRGIYEWDISNPRWREDPSWLLEVIRTNLTNRAADDVERLRQRQAETSDRAWQEVTSRVPFFLRPFLRKLLDGAGQETVQREMARSTLARVVEIGRLMALEAGRRFAGRGLLQRVEDVFFLTWGEIQAVFTGEDTGEGLTALVSDRRVRHRELEKSSPPDYLEEDVPHRAAVDRASGDDVLIGMGVSSGRARGTARLIRHPAEGDRLRHGEVLVAPGTDPAWTPLFLRASALIMETGGMISHGAIVAREYGIPAVINVAGALDILTDGTRVVVDGDEGRVHLEQGTLSSRGM
ncbi:MAG: pyruvate, phosphate dikinase [bacterium]|nr:MAG: pyruvate, phosphate dikinase [bacterium]